jgi:hypothetical protein
LTAVETRATRGADRSALSHTPLQRRKTRHASAFACAKASPRRERVN